MDDSLGLVNDVAGALQLSDHIGPRLQLGQVNFAVLVSGELRRAPRTVYRLDAEPGVGDHLGRVGAVHLDQPDTGLLVVKEVELLNTVSGLQFNFLRGGIHQMPTVSGVHLLNEVGARLTIDEEDFTQGIRLVVAQELSIPPDTEGDTGHGLMAQAVVFDDSQAGQGLIFQSIGNTFPSHHSSGVDLRITLPPLRSGQFLDFVGPRLQLRKRIRAACSGYAGIGGSAFDVLNLYLGSSQAGPGGTVDLFNSKISVGFIFKGNLGHLAILHRDLLNRFPIQQVIRRGHPLVDGIVAHLSQWDGNGPRFRGGVDTDGIAVWTHHLKGGSSKGDGGTGLILGNLERSLFRVRVWGWAWL